MVGSALIHIERQVRGQLELLPFPSKKFYIRQVLGTSYTLLGENICVYVDDKTRKR